MEQYQSGGDQGPWTDVYALAATFYKMITGRKPPASTERWAKDTMKEPSKLGVKIDKNTENALMNALHVRPEDRIRSAADFEEALYSQNVVRTQATVEKTDMGRWPLWAKILGALSGVVVLPWWFSWLPEFWNLPFPWEADCPEAREPCGCPIW